MFKQYLETLLRKNCGNSTVCGVATLHESGDSTNGAGYSVGRSGSSDDTSNYVVNPTSCRRRKMK